MSNVYYAHRRKSFAVSPPAGPVALVGTSTTNAKSDSDTTHSFSHNRLAATKGALVVKSMNRTPVTTVTYGGNSLTKIREEGFASAGCSFWMGDNTLPTGSNTVLITFGSSTSDAVGRVENLENVDQSTLSDADNGSNGSAGSVSNSVTITVDGMAMDCVTTDFFGISKSGGAEQVVLHNSGDSSLETASSRHTTQTAGSRTLGWSFALGDDFGHVIVAVKNG